MDQGHLLDKSAKGQHGEEVTSYVARATDNGKRGTTESPRVEERNLHSRLRRHTRQITRNGQLDPVKDEHLGGATARSSSRAPGQDQGAWSVDSGRSVQTSHLNLECAGKTVILQTCHCCAGATEDQCVKR